MQTLQDLFDHYKRTAPTKGKLVSATNVLIHICKSMNVAKAEDIGRDKFTELINAIDDYYPHSTDKAIQDKSILAEMIGHYGPRDGWEVPFQQLLRSEDSNLRQYVFQVLEYIGIRSPELVLPYIEIYRSSTDLLMRNVASILVGKIFCAGHAEVLKPVIVSWNQQGGRLFIREVAVQLQSANHSFPAESCREFQAWLKDELNISVS